MHSPPHPPASPRRPPCLNPQKPDSKAKPASKGKPVSKGAAKEVRPNLIVSPHSVTALTNEGDRLFDFCRSR